MGFLPGVEAYSGLAPESQGKALKVLSPEDVCLVGCGQFECYVPRLC